MRAAQPVAPGLFFLSDALTWIALQMFERHEDRFRFRIETQSCSAKDAANQADREGKPESADVTLKHGREMAEEPPDRRRAAFPRPRFVHFAVGPGNERLKIAPDLRFEREG